MEPIPVWPGSAGSRAHDPVLVPVLVSLVVLVSPPPLQASSRSPGTRIEARRRIP